MTQVARRLFVALWPDDDARRQVYKLQQQLRYDSELGTVSPVDVNNIHITLHFLSLVAEKDMIMLMQALSSVSGYGYDIKLDRLGYFSKPQILWLGCSQQPEALNELYKSTAQAIKKSIPDYRPKKYIPHITLFRKATRLPQKEKIEEIHWSVNSYVLVESKTYPEGVQYRVLHEWPLMH